MKRFFTASLSILIILSLCACKKMGEELSSNFSSTLDSSPVLQEASDIEDSGESESSGSSSSKKLAPPVDKVADPQNTDPDIVEDDTPPVTITPAVIEPDGSKPLAYISLTENQKKIYSLMSTAIDELNNENIKITNSKGSVSDITVAFRAITFDRPEVFWLSSTYSTANDGSYFKLNYTCTKEQKASMLTTLKQKTNQVKEAVAGMSSRYEKVHYFHDWLCSNVTYSYSTSELVYSAYGALVNGSAVCEGYSRAMQLLCDETGIPCYLIYGRSRGVEHMWNAVELESSWYQLDVTWDDDDSNGFVRHWYLDVTESTMLADHQLSPMFSAGANYESGTSFNFFHENCTATKMSFFYKNNLFLTDDYIATANAVAASPTADKNYCELFVQNSLLATDFNANINEVLNCLNTELAAHGIQIANYSVSANSVLIAW